MRVGVLDYANHGRRTGVEYYALGVIRCLAAHLGPGGLTVYTNDPSAVSQIHPEIVVRTIPGRECRSLRVLWQHFRLPQQVERDRLDILHCPAYVMPLRPCRVPCVITVHDTHVLSHPQWCTYGNRWHYRIALPRSLRRAAGVIAVSQDTRESLVRYFGLLREEVRVIPPGVDSIFTSVPDPRAEDACRRRYHLPDRYVLHVGNLEPRKNVPLAIEAIRHLRDQGFPHTLILAGQFREGTTSLAALVSEAQRQGVVRHLGYVPRMDLPSLYRMADVLLSVSHHEGFGLPALEAMASGVPIVSSMAGAMSETLATVAMAVSIENARSVAEGLRVVLSEPAVRHRMRCTGLRRAAGFYWEKTAGQLLQMYLDLAIPRTTGPAKSDHDHGPGSATSP